MALDCSYHDPDCYDILFGWDRRVEVDFYQRTLARCGAGPGTRILEPACGTGRVATVLAQCGWEVSALDVSPDTLTCLANRAAAAGVSVTTICDDMTRFSCGQSFAAAYNPMSSFRLLLDDASATAHLQSTAATLHPRGIHVLDLTFVAHADGAAVTSDESWEMGDGNVTVRAGNDAVYVDDAGVKRMLVSGQRAHLRDYTVVEFRELVGTSDFRLESSHPEFRRATGISEFRVDPAIGVPADGRAMVVLRRR